LAVCQIEATVADSNSSVDTLTHSFTTLANHTSDVSAQIQHLTRPEELENFKADISRTAAQMKSNINASVSAFQFYDRVCQRLDHVARSLEKVSTVIEEGHVRADPQAWRKIQLDIKNSYTMEAEHAMFESIMSGTSVKEALSVYRRYLAQHPKKSGAPDDEVELF
jgi:TolA-binding protein